MKKDGKSSQEIYLAAKTDNLNFLECLKVLRTVCDLSLTEAKEVIICADTGAKSLNEYQEKQILPALKEAFKLEEEESKKKEEKTST